MKIKALITGIVLASSAVASADPLFSFSARGTWSTSTAPTVRDHRAYEPQYQAPPPPPAFSQQYTQQHAPSYWAQLPEVQTWRSLGSFSNELYGDPVEFRLGRGGRNVSQIMLSGDVSKTRVTEVRINYADGHTDVIKTDRYIGERGTVTTIPYSKNFILNVNAPVRSVTVVAFVPKGSSFSVLAL
jgi:hypothetical protein